MIGGFLMPPRLRYALFRHIGLGPHGSIVDRETEESRLYRLTPEALRQYEIAARYLAGEKGTPVVTVKNVVMAETYASGVLVLDDGTEIPVTLA